MTEMVSALEAAPCPYARSHEAKHVGINWGAGKSAFIAVQDQLNKLSGFCNEESQTEETIATLENNIKSNEANIPAWEAEKVQHEADLEAFKAANTETDDAE